MSSFVSERECVVVVEQQRISRPVSVVRKFKASTFGQLISPLGLLRPLEELETRNL